MLLHGIWALMLLLSDEPFGATPVHGLRLGHRFVTAAVLLAASAMAVRGVGKRGTRLGWFLLLPQQLLLMVTALTAFVAVAVGHYADGVVRPRLFIAADQLPAVIAALCHTFAVVDVHRRQRIRRMRTPLTLR